MDEACAEPGSTLGLNRSVGTLIKAEDDAELETQVSLAMKLAGTSEIGGFAQIVASRLV